MAEVPEPLPVNDEVLVRVLYSSICSTDLEIIKGYMGFNGIPGHEFAGEVVSASSPLFGKIVVGEINCSCGVCYLCRTGRRTHCPSRTVLGIQGHDGAFAGFIAVPERNLHVVPATLALESAVFTEPLAAALEIFEQVKIDPDGHAFIFGAGKLGLLVAQVFRLKGYGYTVFSRSDEKVNNAASMDLRTELVSGLRNTDLAEICIDCTGNAEGIQLALSHLYPRGKLVIKTTVAKTEKIDLNQVVINEFEVIGSRCGPFEPALSLLNKGLVKTQPMITEMVEFKDILKGFEFAARPGTIKVLIRH